MLRCIGGRLRSPQRWPGVGVAAAPAAAAARVQVVAATSRRFGTFFEEWKTSVGLGRVRRRDAEQPDAEADAGALPAKTGDIVPFVAGGRLPKTTPESREFELRQSFQKFPFRREVQLGIMKLGVSVPTRVQDLTIPKLLDGISVLMLAQTGTGKTLAYLLPIIHKLLETNGEGFHPMSRKPRAIIVQPTRELAMQTIKVVRQFPLRSVACCPGNSFVKEAELLISGADIVVGTPFRLLLHLGKENMSLSQLRHLVIDEADTLCDTFYREDVEKLAKGAMEDAKGHRPQLCIVGATRTGAVSAFVRQSLNEAALLPVVTQDAHMTPPQVEQVFVPTRGKRLQAVLWDVLAEMPAVGRKTLVFTNRVESCKKLYRSLLEHGHNAVALYGGIHPKRRKQVWQEFAGGGGAEIMVCTNLASRGLDFNNVHHVVMFEFPLNLADYLHRVGRTARGGRAGRVTTITPRRFWPFVTKIQEAAKAGKPIEVRHATRHAKKLLAMENWMKVAQSSRASKYTKQAMRKRLGLPPARNIGSKATKLAMKMLDRRLASIKHMRFLQSRGILKKGHGIPKMPDAMVEQTETQTVSTLVRARDGMLQLMPRRRRTGGNAAAAELAAAPAVEWARERKEPPARRRRRKKTVM